MKDEGTPVIIGMLCMLVVWLWIIPISPSSNELKKVAVDTKVVEHKKKFKVYNFTTKEGLECIAPTSRIDYRAGLSCNWEKFNKGVLNDSHE